MREIKEENPTRQRIIFLLKKSGGMTADQLSKALSITPMGIRQHLLALEKRGLTNYETRRQGIGRPGYIYMLTDKADDLFPKQYHNMLLDLLEEIERREGRKKVDKLFLWRKDRMVQERMIRLNHGSSLSHKIKRVKDILTEEGYLVEIQDRDDRYLLKQFNCPISVISRNYNECCKYELEMYRELFGKNVSRETCLSEGASACIYSIPKMN